MRENYVWHSPPEKCYSYNEKRVSISRVKRREYILDLTRFLFTYINFSCLFSLFCIVVRFHINRKCSGKKWPQQKILFWNGCMHEKAKCQFYSTFCDAHEWKKYIFSCLYNSHSKWHTQTEKIIFSECFIWEWFKLLSHEMAIRMKKLEYFWNLYELNLHIVWVLN